MIRIEPEQAYTRYGVCGIEGRLHVFRFLHSVRGVGVQIESRFLPVRRIGALGRVYLLDQRLEALSQGPLT